VFGHVVFPAASGAGSNRMASALYTGCRQSNADAPRAISTVARIGSSMLLLSVISMVITAEVSGAWVTPVR
jgi:hypothetical protein